MLRPEDVALVLLAGGRSTRFGAQDKLLVPLSGRALGLWPAERTRALPFAGRIAVTRGELSAAYRAAGFSVVDPGPVAPQSASLKAGFSAAQAWGAKAVLILLADMPLVPDCHIDALLAHGSADKPVFSIARSTPTAMPPALLTLQQANAIARLEGDQGARRLVDGAVLVAADPDWLIDVDTPEDLLRAEALLQRQI